MKTRLELPDPEVKVAVLLVEPVSSSRVGAPTTVTASEKATVIVMESPALYEPSAVEEVTPVIVGDVVSIARALLSAKEPEAPGVAKVSVALFPAASLILPPFSVSAESEAKSRSLVVSPARTV